MKLNDRQQKVIGLMRADPSRDLYQAYNHFDYCVTYTGGEKYEYLNKQDVDHLVAQGLIVPKWPKRLNVQCWILRPASWALNGGGC